MALLRYLLFKSEKRVLFPEQKSELNGNLSEKIIYLLDCVLGVAYDQVSQPVELFTL